MVEILDPCPEGFTERCRMVCRRSASRWGGLMGQADGAADGGLAQDNTTGTPLSVAPASRLLPLRSGSIV